MDRLANSGSASSEPIHQSPCSLTVTHELADRADALHHRDGMQRGWRLRDGSPSDAGRFVRPRRFAAQVISPCMAARSTCRELRADSSPGRSRRLRLRATHRQRARRIGQLLLGIPEETTREAISRGSVVHQSSRHLLHGDQCLRPIQSRRSALPNKRASKSRTDNLTKALQLPEGVSEDEFSGAIAASSHEPRRAETGTQHFLAIDKREFQLWVRKNWTDAIGDCIAGRIARLTEQVDREIGVVLDALRESGRDKDTTCRTDRRSPTRVKKAELVGGDARHFLMNLLDGDRVGQPRVTRSGNRLKLAHGTPLEWRRPPPSDRCLPGTR